MNVDRMLETAWNDLTNAMYRRDLQGVPLDAIVAIVETTNHGVHGRIVRIGEAASLLRAWGAADAAETILTPAHDGLTHCVFRHGRAIQLGGVSWARKGAA